LKLKLDENLGQRLAELFEAAGHDTATVRGQQLFGAADSDLIADGRPFYSPVAARSSYPTGRGLRHLSSPRRECGSTMSSNLPDRLHVVDVQPLAPLRRQVLLHILPVLGEYDDALHAWR
jgi:Domain of unknown function (DUF5615)